MEQNRRITLYAVSTCSHCNSLKEMLKAENLSFESVDVDLLVGKQRRDTLDEIRKVNKRCSFPTLVVNEDVIVGYREDQIKQTLGI